MEPKAKLIERIIGQRTSVLRSSLPAKECEARLETMPSDRLRGSKSRNTLCFQVKEVGLERLLGAVLRGRVDTEGHATRLTCSSRMHDGSVGALLLFICLTVKAALHPSGTARMTVFGSRVDDLSTQAGISLLIAAVFVTILTYGRALAARQHDELVVLVAKTSEGSEQNA